MQNSFEFRIVAITFFITLTISYLLCILGGILFDWTMYQVWVPLLPGFTWPVTVGGFLIGLVWVIGYSLYTATLLVVPYNYLARHYAN